MNDTTILKSIAMISIALLEVAALAAGLDGALFGLVIAAIAGLAGYEVRRARE
jgi:hypothetical protein